MHKELIALHRGSGEEKQRQNRFNGNLIVLDIIYLKEKMKFVTDIIKGKLFGTMKVNKYCV